MANVGSGAAGKTLIGAGTGASPTYASIGTNSGLTAHGILIAQGNGAFKATNTGTTGQVLTSNGAAADPTYQTISGGIPTIASSTDKAIVTWSGTGGNAVQNNSAITIDSSGRVVGAVGTTSNCSFAVGAVNTGVNSTGSTNLALVVSGSTAINVANTSVAVGVNGSTTIGNGFIVKRTATATDATVQLTDYIVAVTSTAAVRTITLPASSGSSQVFIIKDESGGAGTNNINVVVSGGVKTIDGVTSYAISTNYGAITVYYNGSNYFVMSKV